MKLTDSLRFIYSLHHMVLIAVSALVMTACGDDGGTSDSNKGLTGAAIVSVSNVKEYTQHSAVISNLGWAYDTAYLATYSNGTSTVKVLKISDWSEETAGNTFHANWPRNNANSPTFRYQIEKSDGNTAIIKEISTGNPIYTLSGHSNPVAVFSWSADGNYIATGGNDNKVIIWKVTY